MPPLPFRSWCRLCIQGREREEDGRKGAEKKRQVPDIRLNWMFMGSEKEGKTLAFGGQRKSDECGAQHGVSNEVDERTGMSKADGIAS